MSFRLSTQAIVLVPVAVGINYIGKTVAELLRLPLWFDSIGTIIAGMLAGPWVGAAAGAVNNMIYGLTVNPIAFIYAICSIFIGIAAGIIFSRRRTYSFLKLLMLGFILALISALISTLINIKMWGGQTGNIWGDTIFAVMLSQGLPLWFAAFCDEFILELLDKVCGVFITYHLWHRLPEHFIDLFRAGSFEKIAALPVNAHSKEV